MSNFFTLDHLDSLTISGPDAVAFAQAQFTNDIAAIESDRWFPGAWCDPKGRVLTVMLAGRREQRVELVMPVTQIDTVTDRLKLFAIGRKVEFTVGRPVCGSRDVVGNTATLSFDTRRTIVLDQGECRQDDEERTHWQRDDLEARFPWLSPDCAGRHLPQSLGLEALGGLSYSKGCFPGQEVIARVHYRGKVGYRAVHVHFDADSPSPGCALRLEDGRRVGEMLWSLRVGDGTKGLAVVSIEVDDGTQLYAEGSNDGGSGRVSL